jgi:glycosyltransferase involved in cell wall biosynthesis
VGDSDLSPGDGPILLNARAAARPTITGVERWAVELLPRLRALAPERYVVTQPHSPTTGRLLGQAWEQFILPLDAARRRASLVFSPANLAPLAWPRNVMMVHDATVLREPGAYTRTYATWHRRLGVACARRALLVLTVSDFSRHELERLVGLDPERILVIRGGVSERFTPAADAERVALKLGLTRPYVLTVATNDRRKNLAALGETAGRLAALGIELVWAGETRSYIQGASAVTGVRALGYVDEADLPGLYAGALSFVLPSTYEGLGLPCLEAMACGTPVVAADRAALPETCGSAALLVDPDDPAAVADAVIGAATDDEARARLSESGLRRASELTWDRAAVQTHQILARIGPA